jgi:hypothetical protein
MARACVVLGGRSSASGASACGADSLGQRFLWPHTPALETSRRVVVSARRARTMSGDGDAHKDVIARLKEAAKGDAARFENMTVRLTTRRVGGVASLTNDCVLFRRYRRLKTRERDTRGRKTYAKR